MGYLKVFLCVLIPAAYYIKYGYAKPSSDCSAGTSDAYGNFYVSDTKDRCVFYWCLFGMFVAEGEKTFAFSCPPGLGTKPRAMGPGVICDTPTSKCVPDNEDEMTTTEAAEEMTTEAEQSPVRSTLSGMHLPGGTLQNLYRDATRCLLGCITEDKCYAADFNDKYRSCWFHNATSVCNEPVKKPYCTHYKFVECVDTTRTPMLTTTTPRPIRTSTAMRTTLRTTLLTTRRTTVQSTKAPTTTSTTTTVKPTTQDPVFELLSGMNVAGGQKQGGIRDLDKCIETCYIDPACTGLDFDYRDLTCWLHTLASECNEPRPKPGCAHYRLEDVCSAQTTEASSETTMADDDQTTMDGKVDMTTGDMAPDDIPNGFDSMLPNMHLSGGELLLTTAIKQQCLDACLMQAGCLAVDYDKLMETCYGFGRDLYCSEPLPMSGTDHYKRVPCIEGTESSKLKEVRLKFHKPAGLKVCSLCSRALCLEFCFLTSLCRGVDYDERDQGCYMHTEDSVCGVPLAKDFCTHYSFVECDNPNGGGDGNGVTTGMTTEESTAFPAPTEGFIALNYPGPKVLPSFWQAYPGMQVDSGRRVGLALTGDECFQLCLDSDSCSAADFNSYDGSCYFFEADDLRCGTLLSANLVYHVIKPPPCPGYPSPVAVAP